MTIALDRLPRFLGLTASRAAMLVIAVTTIFRLLYSVWLPILPDETYYFQWAKHLDTSYFSKGPAVAYTILAGTSILGPHNLGIRFFAVALSAGTAWQMFLLARRWYDEATGLIAVLITNVVPIYALGAVVMTIDPLSAFFWIWAANLFSRAIQEERVHAWLLTGFAVGSGFLAKYLNALELITFTAFLLAIPQRRRWFCKPHFWLMIAAALFCATPVLWWNWQHQWVSFFQLKDRGHMGGPMQFQAAIFLNFMGLQSVVLSPLLFLSLLMCASGVVYSMLRQGAQIREGELLLFLLFLPVFLLYAALAWHIREEPNWPAVSYLTLIIILAARWCETIASRRKVLSFIIAAYVTAWAQTLLMHDTTILGLPPKMDPMSRVTGWTEIASRLDFLRHERQADTLICDAYKEASVFSFHLPDQPFLYTLRHSPPVNQFDFWAGYPTGLTHRALWITGQPTPDSLRSDFNSITFVERDVVYFKGRALREYTIYQCENR